jgi:predicted membrane protein
VLGVWIGIFVALQVSGISGVRSFNEAVSAGERVRVVSVMGRSEHISRATAFQGADITNVMGKSDIDLRDATLAPGANSTVHVFSAMGTVELRVPPTWTVDTGAISAFGGVRDERVTSARGDVTPAEAGAAPAEADPTARPAPRLVLRGLVMFGRLHITS